MQDRFKLDNTQLKYLAAFFMFIDHFSLLLLDDGTPLYIIGRSIGRLAAPIFFWAITEGAVHTRNIWKYFRNIVVFGIIIQLVYTLSLGHISISDIIFQVDKNIFITLAMGLLVVIAFKKNKGPIFLNYLAAISVCVLGELLNVDYGWYGIAMIIAFYIFKDKKMMLSTSIILLNILRFGYLLDKVDILHNSIQFISILSLPLIFAYNDKRGSGNKYFFYLFYPIHLALLYLLKEILGL